MFTLNSDTANISIDNVTVSMLSENADVVTNTARNNVTTFADGENNDITIDGTWFEFLGIKFTHPDALKNGWKNNYYSKYTLKPKYGSLTRNSYFITDDLTVSKNTTVVISGTDLSHASGDWGKYETTGKFVVQSGAKLVVEAENGTVGNYRRNQRNQKFSDFFEIKEGGTLELRGGTYYFSDDIPETCYDTNVYDKVKNNGSITLKEKEKATVTIVYAGDGLVKEGVINNLHKGNRFTAKVDSELNSGTDIYDFVNWTDNTGKEVSQNAEYSFNVTGDVTLTANYKKRPTIATITLVQNGIESKKGYTQSIEYKIGDRFDARAYNEYTENGTTYVFTGWTYDEKTIANPTDSSKTIFSFDVIGNVTLTANYKVASEAIASSAAVMIDAYNVNTTTDPAVSIDAHYMITGSDYTVEQVGIIYTIDKNSATEGSLNTGVIETIDENTTPLAPGVSKVKIAVSAQKFELDRPDAGQVIAKFPANADAAKDKEIYACAYILVSDAKTGEKKYIFTGWITTSYNANKNGFVGSLTITEPKIGG